MNRYRIARVLACSASVISLSALFGSATNAQTAPVSPAVDQDQDTIIVTGVRASLDRSIDLKRNSSGVVDGISAEDIGKFPDTNLAESLQRITGVSIDRVNGEGSKVTVRGFGPGYNLVTLNGRALPTASIASIGGDQNGDFVSGTTRSFEFSNLASEGVSRLEVYKTARAAITSGGIGATINVVTRKPLDGKVRGFTGSIGAKAVLDSSDTAYARVTPEVSGLLNWSNDDGTFGIGLFGSWQRRNNSAPSATVNDWNVEPFSTFSDPNNGRVTGTTTYQNAPSASTLVAFPNDIRLEYSEFQRERINGQATLQFKPTDSLEITGDVTYYQNKASEQRTDQATWLNRPFSKVVFDSNKQVATAIAITDIISGTKDGGFEQQYRSVKAKMLEFGLNAKFKATDNLTFTLDGQHSKAEALPANPLGHSSTLVAIAEKGIAGQTLSIVNGFPTQAITFNDNPATGGNGNNNGVLDVADLGSQVARSTRSQQAQTTNEVRLDGAWNLGDHNLVSFGGAFRDSKMHQTRVDTYQPLGDWGVAHVGDVQQYAPGVVHSFCLQCQFRHFSPNETGALLTAFRGDATQLYTLLGNKYPGFGSVNGNSDNRVNERIWAAYVQADVSTELMGRPVNIVAGVRYEHTDSTSISLVTPPVQLRWDADNDFTKIAATSAAAVNVSNSYDHILPALDFSVDVTDKFKARVSYGKTIARPDFGSLFSAIDIGSNNPNRPTLLGGIPNATSGNPNLVPLVSDNFDVSFEWYFARSSYLSLGFFDKRVKNFVGAGQENATLFGLRDPSSGAAGTRSGDAANYLKSIGANLSDVNLFTMTALIDQFGLAAAQSQFQANYANGNLSQAFIDSTLAAYNVTANSSDPLYNFRVQKPVNNKEGHIYGLEVAGQYFLGNTGFGVSAAYTLVKGDVSFDITAPTNADQFALLGLSDTANANLIFEKYGLSARLAWNWRGNFLSNNSRGNSRNPVFVKAYNQLDLNISYDITKNIAVSFEGINLTKSDVTTYARTTNQPWFVVEGSSRYLFGARWKF